MKAKSSFVKESVEFRYMMMSRLKRDCEYFMGNGNKNAKHLYFGNVQEQIEEMKELYNLLPEVPEWLTKNELDNLCNAMLECAAKNK